MTRVTRLALGLLGISLVVLFTASARAPLGAPSSDYAALVNQAESSVRRVAERGLGALGDAEGQSGLEQLTKRPLAPILSAWGALSLGRLGLVDGPTSVRLPWLILAALMPLSIFAMLRARWPVRTALGGALWLLCSPGFAASALAVSSSALAVWSGWLVLATYGWAARERSPDVRCVLSLASAVLAWVAFGLSFAALWVLPLLLVHSSAARVGSARAAFGRAYVPVPTTVLLVLAACPLAVVAFDPLLWRADVPGLIRRVFEEEDAVRSFGPRVQGFALPCLLGLVGLLALGRSALARRFATGEFRPARDRSTLGLLLVLGLALAALCSLLGAATGRDFALELLRPILACLVAIGAAGLAARWFARYARWVEAALLLLTLCIRP